MAVVDHLFVGDDWHAVANRQRELVTREVDAIDGDRLLNTPSADLASYLVAKYSIEVPRLIEADIAADQREAQVDVSHDPFRVLIRDRSRPVYVTGTEVVVHVPFEGEAAVFSLRPSTCSTSPPRAAVEKGSLRLSITGIDLDAAQVRGEIDRQLGQIRTTLERLRADANSLNASLPQVAQEAVDRRRAKLLADRNLVASLGFPIKERADSPRTFVAPEVKRRVALTLPDATSAPYTPEPSLSAPNYEHILRVVQSMAHVMERSPSAFVSMDEEALRSHFLVQLNGHFEGQASGETFNYHGKTDILVRSGDRNIFIGECKYWHGPKALSETFDQLLSYSSWRDTKTAIILFNRNRGFSRVLEAIPAQARAHPNFKRELSETSETVFRYVFANRDDRSRELYLTILVFDVPT